MNIIKIIILLLILCSSSHAQEYQSEEINGMNMAYRVVGEGEPLVLLHGFADSGIIWNPIMEELSSEYTVIVPDLRGHGRSTNPSKEFTHRQSALDVFALLDELGIESFRAIGISTGGMTLLHMATTQNKRVEAMVLLGATAYFPQQARDIMISYNPATLPDEVIQNISAMHSRGVPQARELMQQFYDFRNSYDDMNFTPPLLSTITASTLIIHGDRDEFFPVDIPAMEYEAIPDSYLWIVPNGAHVPLLGNEVNRAFFLHTVKQFLSGEWTTD